MALTLATELANYAAGIGTQGATLKIDTNNKRVGVGTTNPQGPEGSLQVGTGITFFGNTGIISAIGGKFSGDFTVGGTLTYEDVQNVNSSGIVTAQSGINIVGGGLTVTGVSTFFSRVSIADSIVHTGDIDTSLRFPAADTFTVETGGSEAIRVDSSQRVMIGQNSAYAATGTGTMMLTASKSASNRTDAAISNQNSGDNASAALVLATHGQDYIFEASGSGNTTDGASAFRILKGSDERLRIDSSGRVLAGLTASVDSNSTLQVEGRNTITAIRYSAATGNAGSKLELSRSASNTVGTTAAVSATDELGEIRFRGASTGSAFNTGAIIAAVITSGTISASSFPTDLFFKTTNNGAASATEKLRITSAGNVSIQNDSGKFTAGAGDDLQIYHDGSNSVIKDNGTGKLILDTDGSAIEFQKAGLETIATFNTDGAVELYHDNSKKFETSASGVTVTGSLNATANLRINGAAVATNGKAVAMALVFG